MDSSPRRPRRRSRLFGDPARDRPRDSAPQFRPGAVLFLELLEVRDLLTLVPGLETLVNSATTGSQGLPALAFSSTGAAAIVWEGISAADADGGIHLQRYDASGAAAGGETLVNSTTANVQARARIAMNAGGAFVVVWQSLVQDGSLNGVYAQRFSAAGAKVGGEILVNTTTAGQQLNPDVAIDSAGNFVVVWRSAAQDPDGSSGVYGQRFSAAGAKLGMEFRVNTTTVAAQQAPAIAADSAGNFVVVWQSFLQDGDDFGVYMQRFSAAGAKLGGETLVPTTTAGEQSNPAVAMHASGAYVVAWQSGGEDGDGGGIYARRFAADGTPLAAPFLVNQTTAFSQTSPRVAVASDGGFLVAWVNNDDAAFSDAEIHARLYDSAGAAVEGEFQANAAEAPLQAAPVVGFASSSRFVAAWHSAGQDGDSLGVYRRVFDVVAGSPPPAIVLGGSSGTESDALSQSFTWSASASAGLASVAVSILHGSTPVHSSSAAIGSFDFDSLGLGDFTLSIEAIDLLGQKTTSAHGVAVVDDDLAAPSILLGGSTGTELDSALQQFTWSIADPSGLGTVGVVIRRDGATIHASSAASGSFDFDGFGVGEYTLDVSAADSDSDWSGDSLSASASRSVTVSDDDVAAPAIHLGGSTGTELDSALQQFTWSIADPSGLATVAVEVKRDGVAIFTSTAASGSFDFDSYGTGVYTLDVSASDADVDWTGDSLSASASRSATVADDDVSPPTIVLGGSFGAELDSATQTFTWAVSDPSGLAAISVVIRRDGTTIHASSAASGSFDFDAFGAGEYTIDVSATDADADWTGDSLPASASRSATVSDDDVASPAILVGGSTGAEPDAAPQFFTWSVSDAGGLAAVAVEVKRDGASIFTSAAASGSFDFDSYGLGEYTLDVTATDADADWGGDSLSSMATRSATVADDDVAPPAILLGGSAGTEFDAVAQQFTWAVSDSSGLAGVSVIVSRDGATIFTSSAASGSFDFDSYGLGEFTLDVSATDADADWGGDSLSSMATRSATVADDDVAPPAIVLGGSSGTESDAAPQFFTWSVSDAGGLAAVAVEVTRDGITIFISGDASGSFDFDALGLGVFGFEVSAVDDDADGTGDALSASASRSVVVVDDDASPPTIVLGGSTGTESDSSDQRFTWSATDPSGIDLVVVEVKRDGITIFTSGDAAGSFDFNSDGVGEYTIELSAADADADWIGDSLSASLSRSASVTDDDDAAPVVLLGGSSGGELDSALQQFTWAVSDPSGLDVASVVVRRDGATIYTSSSASGAFDFDGYGTGEYTLDVAATDGDADGAGDSLSASASRSATVSDDDLSAPTIFLGGSNGPELDASDQNFTWSVGDSSGLSSVSVEVKKDGASIFTSAAASGSFDFDSYGVGEYALEVSATDADGDWAGDGLSATSSRTVTVSDDDVEGPTILLGGSSGAELDGADQSFTWNVGDASGLALVSVDVRKDGLPIFTSGAATGTFDFDGYGLGEYTIEVSATDADADRSGDSLSTASTRTVSVSDDDVEGPTILLGGSSCAELDGADQSFTWNVGDASGLAVVTVEVTKDGLSIFTSTASSGVFDFNSFGIGEYTLEVSATDADADSSGDSLSAISSRTVYVSDDDAEGPTIVLGGSNGAELDSADQTFTWDVGDASGLASLAVEVKKDGTTIHLSAAASGAFDFNAYGTGVFTLDVSAADADGDWSGDGRAATAGRSVVVADDDLSPPVVAVDVVWGENGATILWSATDAGAGIEWVEVVVARDGVEVHQEASAAAAGSWHLAGAPGAAYSVRVEARDADGDWSGDAARGAAERVIAFPGETPSSDAVDAAIARAAEQSVSLASRAALVPLEAERRSFEAAFAVPQAASGTASGAADASQSFESSADRLFAAGEAVFDAAPLEDLVRLRSTGRPGRAAALRDARDARKAVVVLRGSDRSERLEVRLRGTAEVELLVDGVPVGRFPRAAVSLFILDGRGGDDRLELDAELGVPGWLFGGDGDDSLSGGAAADRLFGEGGRDRLEGRGGADELHFDPQADAAVDADAEDVVHPVR